MFEKGFDSAAQEQLLWRWFEQGAPCYWWVPEVYEKHGHAPDWTGDKGEDGKFKKAPPGKMTEEEKAKYKPYTPWSGCSGK